MTVFLDVALGSLTEIDHCLRGAYCLCYQVIILRIEAVSASKMSVGLCETARYSIGCASYYMQ
jgi:hypothetical protein